MRDDPASDILAPEPPDADQSWIGVRGRLKIVWSAARVVLGVLSLVAGVLGTLLPVIPGIPLIIAGVALLGRGHWLVKPIADRLDRWRSDAS
ncbi:MAG: hypothetical protein ABI629_09055 [bacterium]